MALLPRSFKKEFTLYISLFKSKKKIYLTENFLTILEFGHVREITCQESINQITLKFHKFVLLSFSQLSCIRSHRICLTLLIVLTEIMHIYLYFFQIDTKMYADALERLDDLRSKTRSLLEENLSQEKFRLKLPFYRSHHPTEKNYYLE